jgi:hypothetical protein
MKEQMEVLRQWKEDLDDGPGAGMLSKTTLKNSIKDVISYLNKDIDNIHNEFKKIHVSAKRHAELQDQYDKCKKAISLLEKLYEAF